MKRLEEMTLQELWQLFPIHLTPPNPRWPLWADHEICSLRECFGDIPTHIYHIGSTAIHGIWAKPIIDLIVETPDVQSFPTLKALITEAGYICMNESGSRIDFNKGYTPQGFAEKVFHLHLRTSGDCDEIFFRDYLNTHHDVAKEYEALKLSLWKPFEHNRDGYTQGKTDFVSHYTTLAKDLTLRAACGGK